MDEMGAWGFGHFENDDAADWAADLVEMDDAALIEEAFERVLNAKEAYAEAPEAWCALAAAEVVAALKGARGTDLPEEIHGWVEGKPSPEASLIRRAAEAVKAIRESSELRDLIDEQDELEEWEPRVADLERRLAA